MSDLVAAAYQLEDYPYMRNMQVYRHPVSRIISVGVSVPERIVDNDEMAELVEASQAIKERLAQLIYRITRNKTRRYAEEGTSPSDLAVDAARDALERAGLDLADIDTLIFASTDMDTLEPATANIVQQKLAISVVNSFDVTNACNSFLQALNIGNSMIVSGAARRVLITSGEIGSYVCNRRIKVLDDLNIKLGGLTLGDAGAAMILERTTDHSGITEINLTSLGEHWDLCHVPETTDWRKRKDGSIHGWFYLDMQGLAKVARHLSVSYFRDYNDFRRKAFDEEFFMDSLAQIIPHQISRRFIEELARSVMMDINRVCVTSDVYGNTASTAIPLALRTLLDKGELALESGQQVLLYGAASGFGLGHVRLTL